MPSSQDRPATSATGGSWHERATEALSSIGDAVYFLDAEDRFTWVNAAAERLLERPAAGLVGRRVWEEFPDLAGSALHETYRSARQTRQPGAGVLLRPAGPVVPGPGIPQPR